VLLPETVGLADQVIPDLEELLGLPLFLLGGPPTLALGLFFQQLAAVLVV